MAGDNRQVFDVGLLSSSEFVSRSARPTYEPSARYQRCVRVGQSHTQNSGVITWLDEADEDPVFLTVATLAKLRRRMEGLAPGAPRKELESWLREGLR